MYNPSEIEIAILFAFLTALLLGKTLLDELLHLFILKIIVSANLVQLVEVVQPLFGIDETVFHLTHGLAL